MPRPNFGFVGPMDRAHGAGAHSRTRRSQPRRRCAAKSAIGWITHYAIGVAFALLLPAVWGAAWIRHPTLFPALIVGIGTVAAPYFVMQPAMGAGIAASRTPRPTAARLHSLVMHAVFGLGLYAAADAGQPTNPAWVR